MPRPPRSRWMWFSAGATAAVVVATAVLLWQRPTGPEVVWEFDGGPECALDDEDGVAVTVDLVLPVLLCGADGTAFTEDGDADALAAVVALDARSGEQVWRQEWTRPAQRPFPRIDVAADEESYQDGLSSDGTAAVVDDPRLDGTPRVFDLRTGNEAADGLPEAPGAQTWFTGVGTETFVAVRVTEEGTVEYERTDYSGTVTARAAAPVPPDEFVVENSVLLADAVVRLVPGPWVDGDGGPLMDRVEVAVVPWGADRAAHTVEVAAPEPLDGVEGLRLLPVPGAVVVTGAGEDTGALTGLR